MIVVVHIQDAGVAGRRIVSLSAQYNTQPHAETCTPCCLRVVRLALQIEINGNIIGIFESSPGSTLLNSAFNSFGIEETEVESVTFESVGIDDGEWTSLLEVGYTLPPLQYCCGTQTYVTSLVSRPF